MTSEDLQRLHATVWQYYSDIEPPLRCLRIAIHSTVHAMMNDFDPQGDLVYCAISLMLTLGRNHHYETNGIYYNNANIDELLYETVHALYIQNPYQSGISGKLYIEKALWHALYLIGPDYEPLIAQRLVELKTKPYD